jgi:hypothetical protein
VSGHIALDVRFDVMARQTIACASPIEAVERAERLRTRLETYGYRRCRPDPRRNAA